MAKSNVIAPHKDGDLTKIRTVLMDIVNNGDKEKDRIEAGKLLARMHHALQPDKQVTAKATSTSKSDNLQKPLDKAESAELEALLGKPH